MMIRCAKCNYKMKPLQVVLATIGNETNYYKGNSMHNSAEEYGLRCPQCGTRENWKA